MKQYLEIKRKYPDAILLFRVGDFYETFYEDAETVSRVLGLTLTRRNTGSPGGSDIPLAGFPHHSLETYLPRLIRAGFRVAICEQLEDPSQAKGIVRRGVVEVVTPGTAYGSLIEEKRVAYLGALIGNFSRKEFGLALADLAGGEFRVVGGNSETILRILNELDVAELLVPRSQFVRFQQWLESRFSLYPLDDWKFDLSTAQEHIQDVYQVETLRGFVFSRNPLLVQVVGAILIYLREAGFSLHHLEIPRLWELDRYLWLDPFTVRNLELTEPLFGEGKSLMDILDICETPMGSRWLKQWILFPLTDLSVIRMRQKGVQHFLVRSELQQKWQERLKQVGDLERMAGRLGLRKVHPRLFVQIRHSLRPILPEWKEIHPILPPDVQFTEEEWNSIQEFAREVDRLFPEDAPASTDQPGFIADGVDAQLDEYRNLLRSAHQELLRIQQEEAQKTGIPSLKVGYNQVFGYYLEVTHTHRDRVPAHWIRKQTLRNAERYITPELKQLEERIHEAEQKLLEREKEIYEAFVERAQHIYAQVLQKLARALAFVDILVAFARLCRERHWILPQIVEDGPAFLDARGVRHPVVESVLPADRPFVPNDVFLHPEKQQILLITGPNMAGKSVYLRQTALLVILAQMGAPVPAEEVRMGIFDRVFSRVGASDHIALGESTFMVEMTETASILHHLSSRSLVLMDEIGRGTSTYDGIAIAWALLEYLHEHPGRPLVLFATHYHELTEAGDSLPRCRNYTTAVEEMNGKLVFLYRMVPGISKRSFGIEVAKMAGIPQPVIERARQLLRHLEKRTHSPMPGSHGIQASRPTLFSWNTTIYQIQDPVAIEIAREIQELQPDTLRPIDALMKLVEWHEKLQQQRFNPQKNSSSSKPPTHE